MIADPTPDHIVIGFFADTHMMPFLLSSAGMGLHILQADALEFDLKTAVLERGLLVPAELRALLAEGEALRQQAEASGQVARFEAFEADAKAESPQYPNEGRPQWQLTLPEVLMIATAADFAASVHLTSFGTEMREVQLMQGMAPEAFDAQMRETLGYLGRFQREWREIFGEYPSYQARMAELAELRAEFAE